MSMFGVISWVVGKGYLPWPVCYFDKTLSAFALLHMVLWGQTFQLFWVSLDFLGEGNGTPLQYSCLEKSHGRRSLVACSPWGRDFTFTFHFHSLEKEMATHSSVLAWRIPGTGEPGGLPSMGSHRVGHGWSDLAAAWLFIFVFQFPMMKRTSFFFFGVSSRRCCRSS